MSLKITKILAALLVVAILGSHGVDAYATSSVCKSRLKVADKAVKKADKGVSKCEKKQAKGQKAVEKAELKVQKELDRCASKIARLQEKEAELIAGRIQTPICIANELANGTSLGQAAIFCGKLAALQEARIHKATLVRQKRQQACEARANAKRAQVTSAQQRLATYDSELVKAQGAAAAAKADYDKVVLECTTNGQI